MRFVFRLTRSVSLAVLVFLGCRGWAQQAPSAVPPPAANSPQQQIQQSVPSAPEAQTGYITGVVGDTYGDLVSGATVVADDGTPEDRQTTTADNNAVFQFSGIKPGATYHLTVSAKGFVDWASEAISVGRGEFYTIKDIHLKLPEAASSVTVYSDTREIATEQVHIEEQQRVLGFIPNFYVVYDAKNAVPMTAKLKFQMAFKTATDPVSIAGALFLGAVDQANDTPNYQQGWKGYGQRVGAAYADGFTDIMFGGAVLPVLLHQDPRYYYQGTGTTKSRLMHALSYPFICKGDNGRLEPNYSTMGGDLISASLSNLYYPTSNRGPGLVFSNFAIGTSERMLSTVLQEFVLRKFTPKAKKQQD